MFGFGKKKTAADGGMISPHVAAVLAEARERKDRNEREAFAVLDPIIKHDKPGLFYLADAVIKSSLEQPVDTIVTDAISGMVVGQFLTRVLTAHAFRQAIVAPEPIEIVNSQWLANNQDHERLVIERLKQRKSTGENTLVVTEAVDTGGSLARLAERVRKSGMDDPRFAVLVSALPVAELAPVLNAPSESIFMYRPHEGKQHDPAARHPSIMKNIGYEAVAQLAEPREQFHADYYWPANTAINSLYRDMATEYIRDHLPPSTR